jgi:hypothetical protein|tara:strand:+ start:1132 stop:1365 length:234 start_codon:yes stop_codon:yes gene_type:complete
MQLSDQALGALMLALQNSLMNQTDIVPVLKEFDFTETSTGLVVDNPPIVDLTTTENKDSLGGTAVFNDYLDAVDTGT